VNENRAILGLMLQATCPYCGQLANYREISIGTITQCKNCNQKYTYPAIPEPIIVINESTQYKKCDSDDIGLAIALVILAVMAIIGAFILAFVVSQNGVKV
jgi:uncharacterized protein (DUF983 family)